MRFITKLICFWAPWVAMIGIAIGGSIWIANLHETRIPGCGPPYTGLCQWPKPYEQNARQYRRELRWLHELEHPRDYTFPVPRQRV